MQCCFIVDRDLFTGLNVSQGEEENVIPNDLHEGVRHAGVVNVMRTIPAAASVKTPPTIDFADAQHLSMRSSTRFGVRDLLSCVLRNLVAFFKSDGGETAFAVYRRRLDS